MLFQKNIVKKYIGLLDEKLITKAWEKNGTSGGHQGQACVFSPCRLCPRANPFILLTNQSVLPGDHRDGSFDQLSYKPYVLRAS